MSVFVLRRSYRFVVCWFAWGNRHLKNIDLAFNTYNELNEEPLADDNWTLCAILRLYMTHNGSHLQYMGLLEPEHCSNSHGLKLRHLCTDSPSSRNRGQ